MYVFFFFNDTATTEIYTLSLHDALPISAVVHGARVPGPGASGARCGAAGARAHAWTLLVRTRTRTRSEEHTSELQSQSNLVCRLLLEKKQTYDSVHL